MADEKTYSKESKRIAILLFFVLHASLLGMLLFPLYWFWDRIAARPSVLILILGLAAYMLFTWAKLMLAMARSVHKLPER